MESPTSPAGTVRVGLRTMYSLHCSQNRLQINISAAPQLLSRLCKFHSFPSILMALSSVETKISLPRRWSCFSRQLPLRLRNAAMLPFVICNLPFVILNAFLIYAINSRRRVAFPHIGDLRPSAPSPDPVSVPIFIPIAGNRGSDPNRLS
jgi:hypothetical protein